MGELESLDVSDETWGAKAIVMKENIEHHIEEEEGEMFKQARAVFDRQELEDLGARMAERKTSAQRSSASPSAADPRAELERLTRAAARVAALAGGWSRTSAWAGSSRTHGRTRLTQCRRGMSAARRDGVLVEMGRVELPVQNPSPETTTSVSDGLSSTARTGIGTLPDGPVTCP